MLLSQCDESKASLKSSQIWGSNIFFFSFFSFSVSHLHFTLPWAQSVSFTESRSELAPTHLCKNHIVHQKTKGKRN